MNRRTVATIVVGDHIIHLRTSIGDAMMMFGCGPCWECGAKNDCSRKRDFCLAEHFCYLLVELWGLAPIPLLTTSASAPPAALQRQISSQAARPDFEFSLD